MINLKTNTEKQFNDFINSIDDELLSESSLVSFCVELPVTNFYSVLDFFETEQNDIFYFSKPSRTLQIFTVGETISFSFDSIEEYYEYSNELIRLKNKVHHNFNSINYFPALFFSYAKFPSEKTSQVWSEFEKVNFFIPEMIFINDNSKFYIVINTQTENKSVKSELIGFIKSKLERLNNFVNSFSVTDIKSKIRLSKTEEIENWKFKVDDILTHIRKKKFDKLVLSRCTEFNLLTQIWLANLAFSLDNKYPECYNFFFKKKDTLFFGASPEKLFTLKNGIINTEALAGSTERGDNEYDDKLLGSELTNSKKEINEHYFVIIHLQKILSKYCSEVVLEESPSLKKLSNIQHLHTSLGGRVNEGVNIYSIIRDIFPTPAVCGYPVKSTINVIEKIEDFERGLFAGFFGWMDFKDNSEFIVTIRSALIKQSRLYVYAGCGIVLGSDAEKEYKETQLKSQSIISLFDYED